MSICQYVYRELRKMNRVVLYQGDFEPGAYLPIVLFNIQGMTSMETAQELSDNGFALRGGLHCAPLVHASGYVGYRGRSFFTGNV